jgi:DNA-binding NtrC family response regulator
MFSSGIQMTHRTTWKTANNRSENPTSTSENVKLSSRPTDTRGVILVVDDNVSLLKLICTFLEEFGHAVVKAQSAAEAELVFARAEGQINLLITDLNLGDGLGIDRASRCTIRKPSLEVLVISGRLESNVTLAVGERRFQCLSKPFTKHQLLQQVGELLSH